MKRNKKTDKTQNNKNMTLEAIKVILLAYIIGNMLFATAMYFLHDMTYVKEVIVKTGISVVIAVFMLLVVEACERVEAKRWNKKGRETFWGQADCGLLKCSGGYIMLPVATILIDIFMGIMFYKEFGADLSAFAGVMQEEYMREPLLVLFIFHFFSVFVILYYCCYKVCYTDYGIYMVHFLKKINISCGEIKKITYSRTKKDTKIKLIIETREQKLILKKDVLSEGWSDFMAYISDIAGRRSIEIDQVRK